MQATVRDDGRTAVRDRVVVVVVLILIDKQGVTGKKVEYHSIPYRSITHFSIETAGSFDMDAELKIYLSGNPMPIQKSFNKKLDIYELQAVLASYVLR